MVPTLASTTRATASIRRGVAARPPPSPPAGGADARKAQVRTGDGQHPLGRRRLPQHEPAGEGRERGLQAQQHTEHALRQSAQRRELEAVRDDRRQHGRERGEQQEVHIAGHRDGGGDPDGDEEDRRDDEPHRETAAAGDHGPHPGAHADVHDPEPRCDEHEQDAEGVEGLGSDQAVDGEQRHADQGDPDPRGVGEPSGEDRGQHERAEELDRDGRTERDAVDRRIEERVHGGEREPEEDGGRPLTARPPTRPRTHDHDEQQRGDRDAHRRDTPGAEHGEELGGDRGAEGQRQARPDDEGHADQGTGRR